MKATLSCVAVELRPGEIRHSFHHLVGTHEFSEFLLGLCDLRRLGSHHPWEYPSSMSTWRTHERTDSTPEAELTSHLDTVPCSMPSSARKVRTIRTAAALSSGL